ncbi:GGDEF domain-containing protein [Saccharopolyspora sp. HNM0983]|uniref:GGDEF domain-containing protein n=1 Tax=Saccharopolyspora montiporae TaxID=2781240 RepID=A0A929BAH1_9PSEU|nr:GGDEF domain-containing protein [Saccharopolyspora sp. HNM0983]MBE9374800.1 GGDEF domain-containing protein [Saccharopolyspora sp. HNM0983]
MTGLRGGYTGPEPVRDDCAFPAPPPGQRTRQDLASGNGMAEMHESIAGLLAARGQWRQAYHHLRSALDMMSTSDAPKVPEQLRHEVNRLRREHAEAREQSLRDSLTASYNRRYLDERLSSLLADRAGSDGGLAVAIVDLDWFKQVNDTYGHLLGDRVLQRVVDLIQEALPTGAFCARYGGEEFVLVLPDIDPDAAVSLCESTRARVERFPWPQMAPGLRVTISAGLAHEGMPCRRETGPASAEQQLISADALLYAAKQAGRNAVAFQAGAEIRLAGAPDRRATAATGSGGGY